MRIPVTLIAIGAVVAAGCFNIQPPPPPPTTMSAWSPTGGFTLNYGTSGCAGQVRLVDGVAMVTDSCFNGATNAVVCTDNTAPSPVRCTPSLGSLSISGTGADLVSYARVK